MNLYGIFDGCGGIRLKPYLATSWERVADLMGEQGPWLIGHAVTKISWPLMIQVVPYGGHEFLLIPFTDTLMPCIALNMRLSNVTMREGKNLLSRFATALAWHEQSGLDIVDWSSGNKIIRHKRMKMDVVTNYLYLNLNAVNTCSDAATLTAMALFREGLSTKNQFYAALNYFKVLEVFFKSDDRITWMKDALARLPHGRGKNRVTNLSIDHSDVGEYLFKQGRLAIAHAQHKPAINPDLDEDRYRIMLDVDVFRDLAQMCISEKGGIPLSRTVGQQGRNEIAPFIGDQTSELMNTFMKPQNISDGMSVNLPESVSLIVRNQGDAVILSNMKPIHAERNENGFLVLFCSPSGVNKIPLFFDVRLKKLAPVANNLPNVHRTASRDILDEVAQAVFFHDALWRNGCVIVWDEERDIELARSAEFVPVNMIYNRDAIVAFVEEMGALIAAFDLDPSSQNTA